MNRVKPWNTIDEMKKDLENLVSAVRDNNEMGPIVWHVLIMINWIYAKLIVTYKETSLPHSNIDFKTHHEAFEAILLCPRIIGSDKETMDKFAKAREACNWILTYPFIEREKIDNAKATLNKNGVRD